MQANEIYCYYSSMKNHLLINFLSDLSTVFRVNLDKVMTEIGLNGGQVFILVLLWEDEGLSQVEIAGKLNVTTPTINKMVSSLSRKEFIICRKCKTDGRIQRVFLTEKGKNYQQKVFAQFDKLEEKLLRDVTETEKLILLQLVEKLRNNLIQ